MSKPKPIAQVVAVEPAGPDGHGVNWLGGKPPKPGDLLYRAEDINQGRAGLREAAQHALVTLDGIADTNPRDTADFETPAEWITWAKSRARWAADKLRAPISRELLAERVLKQMLEQDAALTQPAKAGEAVAKDRLPVAGYSNARGEEEALVYLKDALALTASQEQAAQAWDEGYHQGVADERTSEANIGVAGFGAKVEPARQNPYRTTSSTRQEQAKWTDADSDAARLALELECLLLDTKDTAAASRWWSSALEALELHRARINASQEQAAFSEALRSTIERSKAAPIGVAVEIDPLVSAEFRKAVRGEPSRFDRLLSQEQAQQPKHVLYETSDKDRPKEICDRNGEVVLGQCKVCGKAEAELDGPCTGQQPSGGEVVAWRWRNSVGDIVTNWREFKASQQESIEQQVAEAGGAIEYAYSATKPEPMTEHQRGSLVMEHLGPAALAGGQMSPLDAFTLGIEATERHHHITSSKKPPHA